MYRTLFVAHQHVIDASDRVQGIVDIKYGPAGITEHMLNALID
ncbi:Acetolactate synthase large subunit [Yersinia bercovieri ATCC 43970]|uniref:Acetolactate synthase large subunit n=1 Tax=Yersinia bercovieri ATCC 43970 TaxID=349968 RepID=A0ABP2E6D9_YERBE|nr:Acetolactate synthase large subunit [Yersinia bercovieri ATCC 43970]